SSYINDSDPLIRERLAATDPKDLPQLLQKLDGQVELIKLEFPIVHNNVLLGRFLVGISRQALQSEFRQKLIVQIAVFIIIVLFLSTAIHAVFRYNVLFPIQRLIVASENVGRGEY